MGFVGFHASHEQFPPGELLSLARAAESAGFAHAMCSDHLAPFGEAQGQSGFAWSWLGAALEATRMPFGVVTAPGQRYHPAVVAQAAATLAEMYPGRFWVAFGSGQNLNEHVTGDAWPPPDVRRARLRECVEVVRALWAGETVTHFGLVRVAQAKLYTRPATPPRLFGAAVSPESASLVGGWADGLITVNQPEPALRRVVEAFRAGGGEGKPMFLQAHVAYAPDEGAALAAAHEQWKTNALTGPLLWDVPLPAEFDAAATFVRPEDMRESVRVSSDLGRHRAWLERDRELGFERVYVHEVGREQRRSLEAFGEHVLPRLG
ncbi:MAG TPA: TIGR03885 family FMN-dependent LLM class oxidoreductase [Polyangiaceae bacterium]|nr:TIGR03885 family FMN-dependent LLM class oxidoreductase [Polyangiaceae bacterium]